MPFIRWDRPRGSVHDVQKALALAGTGCNLLVLSDASLYVLQNYMALDVEFKARWADEVLEGGYIPISEESANYGAWVDLVEQIQGEVVDMSCDIVAELQNIRESIDALAAEQSSWDDLLTDLLLPLTEVATSADILGLSAAVRDQQLQCCDALAGQPYFPGNPTDTQNPATSTFCQRADSLALNWEESAGELFRLAKTITSVGLGLVSIVVAALSLPIAILMAIVAIIIGGIAELTEGTYLAYFADLRVLIRCAVFNAPNPTEAKVDVDAEIDAYVSQLTSIEKTLLKHLVGYEALNAVFAETYTIRTDAVSDCSSCFTGLDCLTFDGHLYDFQEWEGGSCGLLQWSSDGHTSAGSLHISIENGCDIEVGQSFYWFGTVVAQGDQFTVWNKSDGPDAFNVAMDVFYTDASSQQAALTDAGHNWTQMTITVDAGHAGKTVDYVLLGMQKSLNSQHRDAWYDELCYEPV